MNAIFISQRKILPLNDGAIIYSYGLLQYLKEIGVETTFISFYENEDYTKNEKEQLEKFCKYIHSVKLIWKSIALNMSFKYPNNIRKYTRQAMFRKLNEIIKNSHFDLVFIDHLHVFEYAKLFKSTRIILIEHNVESEIWLDYVSKCHWLIKIFARRCAEMTVEYEKNAINAATSVLAITETDAKKMQKMSPSANIYVMRPYNLYDLVKSQEDIQRKTRKILFIGSYSWYPNQEAAKFLVTEVMPILRKLVPGIQLYLVGKDPTNTILQYGKNFHDVNVTGMVYSVDPYIRECDVFVNAMFSGSGMNIKMIEAMGKGIPIISSEYGARGINVIPSEHFLIFKEAKDCISCIIELLNDRNMAVRLSRAARAFYKDFVEPDKLVYESIMGKQNS